MKCCCGWGCHYFGSCTSPALFIGWWRLWMSLASSVGAAQEKAVTQLSPGCRTVHMLGMGTAGDSQNTHKGSLCAASGAQVGASMIWIAKSLCAGHLDRPRFSCSPSLTLQLFRKKADCTELRENIWEVGDRHITADPWLPLLMEYKGFAISISCSKAWGAARPGEGRIWCSNFPCSHIPWCDTGIQLGQWLSSGIDRSRDFLPPSPPCWVCSCHHLVT